MIGLAAGHGQKVRQPSSAKGGSLDLEVDTSARIVSTVTLVSGPRPVTVRFYDAGVLVHTIAHPPSTTTTYDVTGQNIPVLEHSITKPDASTKFILRPEYAVQW